MNDLSIQDELTPPAPLSPTDEATIQHVYEACALDRVFFAEGVLGITLDPWQKRLLQDMDTGKTRMTVRSAHGVGKTMLCALVMLHFLLFREGGTKIVCTSPSSSQLMDGLMGEVVLWMKRLPSFLSDRLEVKRARIVDVEDISNRWISFRTARLETPEAIAGIHAQNTMLVIDEASGVPQPIYEAGSGTLSTLGAICLLIGNPSRTSGYFYNTHRVDSKWSKYHVSAFDSPRVSETFIDDIKQNFGEGSPQWKIRVEGEFADQDEDVIIPRDLVEGAVGRDISPGLDDEIVWGIDPGRGGDATGFMCRKGPRVTHLEEFHLSDLMALTGRIFGYWDDLGEADKPSSVYVDSIGLGAGVADRLRELGLPVTDVNVSESPSMKEKYPRLRDELWWEGRAWFESRAVHLPDTTLGRELVEELCAPLMVFTASGKNSVESKSDMKRRGIKSPNLADALLLTFAFGGATAVGRGGGRKAAWNRPIRRRIKGVF